MKNKLALSCLFLFLVLAISGCGKKEPDMNVLSADGSFHYQNKDLKFSLALPADFNYYQVQRKDTPDYIDIEFFVPTTDKGYEQELSDYAKPVKVRIYKNKDAWSEVAKAQGDEPIFIKVGETKEYVYTLNFWKTRPIDWQPKWSDEMKKKIEDGFKIL